MTAPNYLSGKPREKKQPGHWIETRPAWLRIPLYFICGFGAFSVLAAAAMLLGVISTMMFVCYIWFS